jgi:hypothetical protein
MAAKVEGAAKSVFDPSTYTQTMKATGTQSNSGQVDCDAKGQRHPADFAAWARATYTALRAHVEAGAGTLENIVKLTTGRCPRLLRVGVREALRSEHRHRPSSDRLPRAPQFQADTR